MRLPLLALLVPAICLAQTQGQPRLLLEESHYEFGRISPGASVTHRFKASNAGDSPLTISRLNPSCGCTSTLVGKSTLAPGESTELEVTFNAAGHPGMNQKSVEVISDDPTHPVQTLSFGAEVMQDIEPSVQEVRFEDLVLKDRRKASVKLTSETGQPMRVTSADLSVAPWLGVTTREEGLEVYVDLVLLARLLPPGKLTGVDTIALHLVNPNPTEFKLRVLWKRRDPVLVSPARVAWAEAAGQELRAALTLKNPEHRPFRILSTRTSNPLIRLSGIAPRGAVEQKLVVLLSKDAKPGEYDEKAYLTLDTPGHPELEIRVAASLH
jgi:hypothetical protein